MDKISHFHIPVNDVERAKKFYNSIFGWKIVDTDKYYKMIFTTSIDKNGRPNELGGINGAFFIRQISEDTVSLMIRVKSIDDCLKEIEKVGCKIITKKIPAGNIGFHAFFYDTEGNVMGLWEEKPR